MKAGDEPGDETKHERIDDECEEAQSEDVNRQGQYNHERADVSVDNRQQRGGADNRLPLIQRDAVKRVVDDQQRQYIADEVC